MLQLYSNPPVFRDFVDHHADALVRLVDRVLAKNQPKRKAVKSTRGKQEEMSACAGD